MGNIFGTNNNEQRILLQGLDAAGKTSILYKLKLGEVVSTIPTIGFNVETVKVNNIDLCCWDIGGRDKIRPLLRHYYQNTQGLVLVIDSNDRERLDEAFDEFVQYSLNDDMLKGTIVMVVANKQDLDGALSCEEVERQWHEKVKSKTDHEIFFRPCSVVTGEGLFEAFTEFATKMKEKAVNKEQQELDDAVLRREMSFNLLMKSPSRFLKCLLMY